MKPKVAVVRCPSYKADVYSAVEEAVRLAGGLKVRKGMKVLIKPNLLAAESPDKAITTHPAVIEALCKILKKIGAEIWIGESPGSPMSEKELDESKLFKVSGIKEVAEKYDAKIIPFDKMVCAKIRNESGVIMREFHVAKTLLDADYIIDAPKLKTHVLVKYTGAVKNMLGCIQGGAKGRCHFLAPEAERFSNLLLDLYFAIKPDFVLMDGIVGIEGDGPGTGGTPKDTGIILASRDGVALDIIASGIIGFDPMEILTNRLAILRNLSSKDIEVAGDKDVSVPYRKPHSSPLLGLRNVGPLRGFFAWFSRLFLPKPDVNVKNCRKCGVCAEVCPVKAIEYAPYPKWDRGLCILCYRCHELCPHNAIVLHRSRIIEILASFYRMAVRRK